MTYEFSRISRRRVLRAAMACAVSLGAFAPVAAQACNPFQFLFGGCRPQQEPRQMFTPIPSPLARSVAPARHAIKKVARPAIPRASLARSGGVSGKQIALKPEADAPVGSLALFARDRTLRPGDIVVTKAGFLVYGGRTGAFAPISHDSGALATLEKASMKGQNAAFATPTRVTAARMTQDPEPKVPETKAPMTQGTARQTSASQTSSSISPPLQHATPGATRDIALPSPPVPTVNSWLAIRREIAIERIAVKTSGGFGG